MSPRSGAIRPIDRIAVLALCTTFLLWGTAVPAIRVALRHFPPLPMALYRMICASIALGIYAVATRQRLPRMEDLPRLLLVAGTGVAGFHLLINRGLVTITAGSSSLIVNTAPVFTAVFAVILLKEKINRWGMLGFLVSLNGSLVIALAEGKGLALSGGAIFAMGAAVCWGVNIVLQKPLLSRYSALEVTSYSIWLGTVMLMPGMVSLFDIIPAQSLSVNLFMVYLGVFPIAVAYVTWATVLSRFNASRAASFLYLVPVVAMLSGWAILHEIPKLMTMLGGSLSILGVVIINGKGRPSPASSSANI